MHLLITAGMIGMIPYFFASGHFIYTRYRLYYFRSIAKIPESVLLAFLDGEHVMRHQSGLWNVIWSDRYIECTFMRYCHGPKGIIGITLRLSTLKRWAFSLHIYI